MSKACQIFLVPSRSSDTPLYPSKCRELGSVPRLLLLPLFSYLGTHLGPLRSWECVRKNEDLESLGTPECSELNSKAQNTLHWSVLGVIGKVLKRRYRKWPHIGHLDIYNSSYGQKKGRESRPGIDLFPTSDLGVRHGVEKISTRATTLV